MAAALGFWKLGGKSADQDMQIYTRRFGRVRLLECSLSVNANYDSFVCINIFNKTTLNAIIS